MSSPSRNIDDQDHSHSYPPLSLFFVAVKGDYNYPRALATARQSYWPPAGTVPIMASLPSHQQPQTPAARDEEQEQQQGSGSKETAGQASPSESVLVDSSPRSLGRAGDTPQTSPSDQPTAEPGSTSTSRPPADKDVANILEGHPPTETTQDDAAHPPPPIQRSLTSSSNSIRRCWICFADENEDAPDASRWRSPCPCNLTAHESCLLDWIADLETAASTSPRKIECPQCKSEIKIARPTSMVVKGVQAVERCCATIVVPGLAAAFVGGVWSACFVHGALSVMMVLGAEDWQRLVEANAVGAGRLGMDFYGRQGAKMIGAKMALGLPMVPIVLVLSRTKVADGLLPMLPMILFMDQLGSGSMTGGWIIRGRKPQGDMWPPSAALAFASLPYVRAAYNAFYGRFFAERERMWIKQVQRQVDPVEAEENRREGALDAENVVQEGDFEIELNAEIGIFNEDEPERPVQQPQPDQGQNAQQGQGRNQNGNPNGNLNGQNHQHHHHHGQNQLVVSASKLADTILGALCMPAIAAVAGEVLNVSLPKAWTSATSDRRPGILHTKWGRSIVGGCLFVVLKDALLLYSRYQLAKNHKKRSIVDYNGRRGGSASVRQQNS